MTQAQATNREPTMEEILASIRRIIEDNNAPKETELNDVNEEISVASNATVTTNTEVTDFEREFALADVFSKPVQNTIVAQESARSPAPAYVEPAIDLPVTYSQSAASKAPAVEVTEARDAFQDLRPIISENASRQVAKSFESLSAALVEERNTSVAQMTEEMVRPMLQDWLDNNLPTLVERLVREEIERVSRGTR
jgi:uncharacterized protein